MIQIEEILKNLLNTLFGRDLNNDVDQDDQVNKNDFTELDLLQNPKNAREILISYLSKLFHNFSQVVPKVN